MLFICSYYEDSCNICGWPQIKLQPHSAYTSLIHQTREHKAWHFSIFITSTNSINWKISPASCGTLTSCWNLLHQTNGLYYTRDLFISTNLLGWQKPTEFSTFHQSCQQFPGFGRLTNKILLVKAEILSPGPVAASLPHTENRSQLSTSDHCLKGHLKA